jgi:hypothetical protein
MASSRLRQFFPKHRTIREEPKYREQLDGLACNIERLDEVLSGLLFALSNAPEQFEQVQGVISVAKTDIYDGAPGLRVYFTYDDLEVQLLAVEFTSDDC